MTVPPDTGPAAGFSGRCFRQSGRRILYFLLLASFFQGGFTGIKAQKIRKINYIARSVEFVQRMGKEATRLSGDVVFKQDSILMYCDSAYFFPELNLVHAYGDIHVNRGDTLHLYGDFLTYSGNERVARIRENVLLTDMETELRTMHLDFDFTRNVGKYKKGGFITSEENHLQSEEGRYNTDNKNYFFRDSVIIRNPDYTIYSDTLRYNTRTGIAYFFGPTDIISRENYIYCENGWYDTEKDISQFNRNALLINESQRLGGDSLYYERKTGTGHAFGNVTLNDTARNIVLCGQYANYGEYPEYAMITDSALLIIIEDRDSLFVHADTLISSMDSANAARIMRAFNHVKFYRHDIQGKCDSLVYPEADSVFLLYGNPVLWSGRYQLTAEFLEIRMANKQLENIRMINQAFIISRDDSVHFNQIKGRGMTGYFHNEVLERIVVKGNGQTRYFARDKSDRLIGLNMAESANIIIYLKEEKISRINLVTNPDAELIPEKDISPGDMKLKGFAWYEKNRPGSRFEIFEWEGNIQSE